MIKSITIYFLLIALFTTAFGQDRELQEDRLNYIEKYKELAVKEMFESKIPASITLAQACLESGNGKSELAHNANNHFGIKCHKEWNGPGFYMDDDKANECFRKYKAVYESYVDHSDFLRTRSRYDGLFTLDIRDYKGWAHGLKKAGYATNPKYAHLLIEIIEDYELYQYDGAKFEGLEPIAIEEKRPGISKEAGNGKDFPDVSLPGSPRDIKLNNRIKYIIARNGDDVAGISVDLHMMEWQIYKYNELAKNEMIKAGQIIYLQPKRKKADIKYHIVEKGETMYCISQKYGIKMKYLYSKNRMEAGQKPKTGDKLWLKSIKPPDESQLRL